ncbi:MAG: STAS domain-containing protein [Phycisphaerales bacterium]|nr:STAS domain-containing protein [Phycisphaerales bacterium]
MSDPSLAIDVAQRAGAVVVAPRGDIDLNGSPMLKVELRRVGNASPPPERLVIDLSGVSYMDSSGLATLVESLQLSKRNRYRLVICGLQPRVRAIFDIAKLGTVFTIVPTLDIALTV